MTGAKKYHTEKKYITKKYINATDAFTRKANQSSAQCEEFSHNYQFLRINCSYTVSQPERSRIHELICDAPSVDREEPRGKDTHRVFARALLQERPTGMVH
jgi:hypothetical protein